MKSKVAAQLKVRITYFKIKMPGNVDISTFGRSVMFTLIIVRKCFLKLIELRDSERILDLTNNSRSYLREWIPLIYNTKIRKTVFVKFVVFRRKLIMIL